MGRKPMTPDQRAKMRARILDAARDRFLAEGLSGLSMRGIASKVGVSSMTLYLYYESRHDIVRHIVAEGFRMLNDALAGHEGVKDPADRIQKMSDAYVSFALEQPKYYAAMFLIPLEEGNESTRAMLAEPAAGAVKQFEKAFGEASKAGAEAKKRAAALWAALHGLAMLAVGGHLQAVGGKPKDIGAVITGTWAKALKG